MLVFVLVCSILCSFKFCNHIDEEERELAALSLLSFGCFVTATVM